MGNLQRQDAAEKALHDQTNFLPHRRLILTFFVLAITLLVYFIDQNGVGQILPTVAKDLHATNTISWAGTSSLIGNTTFQVLYGRLSDIFGRKRIYLTAVALLSFSELMCGLSKNAPMFYVFRGLSGVGGGGITSLSMMIVSDIVSLERRGKYQGILGSMVGIGNLIGPILAATFAQKNWRGLFWLICPTAALCGCVAWYFLPNSMPKGDFRDNVKKIDYWGCSTASIGLILVLIPVSGGGSYFQWDSAMVISMITIGGLFMIGFVFVEWKVAKLPMMPLSLFTNTPVAAMLFQNFIFGMCFYNQQYVLPLYYQNVRRLTPIHSALMTLPLTVVQSFASIGSGQYISRRKRYGEVIWFGFILFTLGNCLQLLFNRTTPFWTIGLILGINGYGNGNVFQPTIIALQAHCLKSQRAVVISVRNFLRCLGGACGLAISSAILQNMLKNQLPPQFKYLAQSTYAKPDYADFSAADGLLINEAYAKASHTVWIFQASVSGLALLGCFLVKDRGLTRPDEEPETQQTPTDPEKGMIQKDKEGGVLADNLASEKTSVHSTESEVEKDDHGSQNGLDEILRAEVVPEIGELGDPEPIGDSKGRL